MNNFHRPHGGVQEADAPDEAVRSPFSDLAGRFANWMTGADRLPADGDRRPLEAPEMSQRRRAAGARLTATSPRASRWLRSATTATAVDEHVAKLERELEQLRGKQAPLASITDELERIGEQTASILVVAHDQAHETTRLAQEQAERCVADAAANAVQMTADAKAKLRDLDAETDAVWRERERLLEDVRVVSAALANLANQASERFPAAEPTPSTGSFAAVAAPARGLWEQAEYAAEPERARGRGAESEAGRAAGHRALQRRSRTTARRRARSPQPGDTGSWLAGLEPPDLQADR